jgi:hypothetical protein
MLTLDRKRFTDSTKDYRNTFAFIWSPAENPFSVTRLSPKTAGFGQAGVPVERFKFRHEDGAI